MPAPYVARYHWVALERFDALPERELKELLRKAYQLILEKLPRKAKADLESPSATAKKKVKATIILKAEFRAVTETSTPPVRNYQ